MKEYKTSGICEIARSIQKIRQLNNKIQVKKKTFEKSRVNEIMSIIV